MNLADLPTDPGVKVTYNPPRRTVEDILATETPDFIRMTARLLRADAEAGATLSCTGRGVRPPAASS
jgi:hypothetical protein